VAQRVAAALKELQERAETGREWSALSGIVAVDDELSAQYDHGVSLSLVGDGDATSWPDRS
jgi:hypothetical protein